MKSIFQAKNGFYFSCEYLNNAEFKHNRATGKDASKINGFLVGIAYSI
jgi:hypothetical protein